MTEAMPTIVQRLLEPKASLFYTDSTMRTVEVQRPLPIEREAAAEIERLQARVKELEDGIQKIRRDDLDASDDEECPLCGGIGELEAYVEGTSRQTDYVGCPECLVRHHNEIARAVLQSSK